MKQHCRLARFQSGFVPICLPVRKGILSLNNYGDMMWSIPLCYFSAIQLCIFTHLLTDFFFLGLVRILWCCSPFRDEWTRAGLPLNALSVLLMDSAITRTHTLINIQSRLWLIRIETIDFCPPRLSREITDGFIIWGKEERMTAPGRTLHERRRWWSMCVIIKWRRRSGNVETNK